MGLGRIFRVLGRVLGIKKRRKSRGERRLRRKPRRKSRSPQRARVSRRRNKRGLKKKIFRGRKSRRRHLRKRRPIKKAERPAGKFSVGKRLKRSGNPRLPARPNVPSGPRQPLNNWLYVGEISHYFPKVRAAVLVCKSTVSIADAIWIKGNTTDFRQTVSSLQINRQPIERAGKGQEIGLGVLKDVRVGDKIFRPKS